ncbi:4848_t:CDS:2 [Acaulospora morrowiae]|uniref:4848_t:CDS:1 n=1 Tax=Acaulospora morrowiae TaxID=94023 RepID=A0A9N8W2A4_9GLOM|nr:4848_t:CDS:2 [Acaulospora morrowiae]
MSQKIDIEQNVAVMKEPLMIHKNRQKINEKEEDGSEGQDETIKTIAGELDIVQKEELSTS